MWIRISVLACGVLVALLPQAVSAQGRVVPPPDIGDGVIRAAPGPRYDAGPIHRFLLGDGWRDVWVLPLTLRTLPIDTFAGGLTPEREGGNKQSMTLHFIDAKGTGWVFRSMDKYPAEKLAEELEGTPGGTLVQDQISSLHPTAALVLPPMLEALGILHVEPVLYVMPDAAGLGEYRERFAGMIGTLELKPNEGENDTPGFAGSRKIRDTDAFLDELRGSPIHRVASREVLRARLLDFIIGDTDRTADQYRFARFPDADHGGYVWRPIPRDRDWTFIRPNGLIPPIAAGSVLPKAAVFGDEHTGILSHTFSGHVVDRSTLAGLDRAAFTEEVAAVQAALTDRVIEAAVARLPESYPESHRRELADAMKSRRDALDGIAADFYSVLASDVDVHGTALPERAELIRHEDGRLEVTLTSRRDVTANDGGADLVQDTLVQFHRIFHPSETDEVRVYLLEGEDTAVVRGTSNAITVRIIGGKGNDVLADSSGSGSVHLYDAEGENRLTAADGTRVDTRPYDAPEPSEGLRMDLDWAPDWGRTRSWGAELDYGDAAGVVLGFGPSFTEYHFRRLPYRWRVDVRGLIGVDQMTPGIKAQADYRFENSTRSIETEVSWPGYDSFRWFGLGNDTDRLIGEQTLVRMDRLAVESSHIWRFGQWREADRDDDDAEEAESDSATAEAEKAGLRAMRGSFGLGPVLRYTTTDAPEFGPFMTTQPLAFDPLWQAGARAEFALQHTDGNAVPRRGYRLRAVAEGFPGVLDLPGAYGTARAEVNGYVPLVGNGLHLAVRAGAIRAIGDAPAFDAAAIGGRRTLRGFSSRRFTGDAATYGGLELRAPLGEVPFIVRGEMGVFGLVDAGRVWDDGASPGGWHSGYGAGLWFAAFDRAVSVAWASGERSKFYVWLGLPF